MKDLLKKFDGTFYLTFLVVLIFVFVVFLNQSKWIKDFKENYSSKLEVGSVASFFVLKTQNEKEISLEEEVKENEITILFFFETWCGGCQKQASDLITVYNEYKDKGVEIYGIDILKEKDEDLNKFINDYGINFPILIDDGSKVSTQYGIKKTPTIFFLDKKGIIKNKFEKRKDLEKIKEVIDNILGEK